jgi:hypothetical protein
MSIREWVSASKQFIEMNFLIILNFDNVALATTELLVRTSYWLKDTFWWYGFGWSGFGWSGFGWSGFGWSGFGWSDKLGYNLILLMWILRILTNIWYSFDDLDIFLHFAFLEFDASSISHQCNPCSQLNTYLLALSSTSFATEHSSFLSTTQNNEKIMTYILLRDSTCIVK